jgi:hypothetical protein
MPFEYKRVPYAENYNDDPHQRRGPGAARRIARLQLDDSLETDADGDLSYSSGTEEERLESAEEPVAQRQVRRPVASTAQDDQLLLEKEILRDHRSHATGATQLRGS